MRTHAVIPILMVLLLGLTTAAAAALDPAATELMSVSSTGGASNGDSTANSVSADGRLVAFQSAAGNLVAGDGNGRSDIFVRDRAAGTTQRVSVSSSGTEADGPSLSPALSADGRFVAFQSYATNLVAGDTNLRSDIFVRDRASGTTERVSVPGGGGEGNEDSSAPALSADGRYVAFVSLAGNLVPNDTNEAADIFVHDRQTRTTERVSLSSAGREASGASDRPSLSADGRFVAFQSPAGNLVAGDSNYTSDVFLRDRSAGTTEVISTSTSGAWGSGPSLGASVSADGRYVAFYSYASNLAAGDTNGTYDVFLRDRQARATSRVSLGDAGSQGNGTSDRPSLSADGQYVAFQSLSTNLVGGDTNGRWDVFVRDLALGRTERASVSSTGVEGNGDSNWPALSGGGRFVSFYSYASNLAAGDNRYGYDVFLRDRGNQDTTPPVATVTLSGTAGANGWYTSNVLVTLAATDQGGSGVREITYSATGAQPLVSTTASGATVSFSITAEGETAVTFYARDHAGNVEVAKTVVVRVDKTAPAISIAAPNAGPYLLGQVVQSSYSVVDPVSGVRSSLRTAGNGDPVDTSLPGSRTFAVSATDNAGNSATRTVTYQVAYGVRVLADPGRAANGGSTIPIRLQVVDASGANRSAASIQVVAQGVVPGGAASDPGKANPDNSFRYDAALGDTGGYIYNLSTKELPPGSYSLNVAVAGDPTLHALPFVVK